MDGYLGNLYYTTGTLQNDLCILPTHPLSLCCGGVCISYNMYIHEMWSLCACVDEIGCLCVDEMWSLCVCG